jgi:solute carrier family 35 protein E1
MACSTNWRANFLGIVSAFASAILFVTQNIVSKKIFVAAELAEKEPQLTRKPDKLNLLCYSSLLGLAFTSPLWLWSEGWSIILHFLKEGTIELSGRPGSHGHSALALEFVINGTFHFLQSLSAFVLLSMVSPVTYSVASLVKRVFVIIFSIIWFGNHPTSIQGVGIMLTLLGLYLYDRTSDAAKADRRARLLQSTNGTLLPLVEKQNESPPPSVTSFSRQQLFGAPQAGFSEKSTSNLQEYGDNGKLNGWLPAGTKAENTWNRHDMAVGVS